MSREVIAYVNWGRWVGDCATPGCGNARMLSPGEQVFDCDAPGRPGAPRPVEGVCAESYPIVWPDDPAAVMAPLAGLPEGQRNWKPEPEETDDAAR